MSNFAGAVVVYTCISITLSHIQSFHVAINAYIYILFVVVIVWRAEWDKFSTHNLINKTVNVVFISFTDDQFLLNFCWIFLGDAQFQCWQFFADQNGNGNSNEMCFVLRQMQSESSLHTKMHTKIEWNSKTNGKNTTKRKKSTNTATSTTTTTTKLNSQAWNWEFKCCVLNVPTKSHSICW